MILFRCPTCESLFLAMDLATNVGLEPLELAALPCVSCLHSATAPLNGR